MILTANQRERLLADADYRCDLCGAVHEQSGLHDRYGYWHKESDAHDMGIKEKQRLFLNNHGKSLCGVLVVLRVYSGLVLCSICGGKIIAAMKTTGE